MLDCVLRRLILARRFNWYSAPAFAAMVVFWLLAMYIVTRGPGRAVALATAATQVAAAAFLLVQGMEANATTVEDWRPWARNLDWGSTVALVLWFWVTVLSLRDMEDSRPTTYLRWVGYPLGTVLALVSVVLVVANLTGESIQVWGAPVPVSPDVDPLFRCHIPLGPLYWCVVAFTAGTTFGAVVNVGVGARRSTDPDRRRHSRWLLVSGVIFLIGANALAISTWLDAQWWPDWLSDLAFGVGLVLMAVNVAVYGSLLQGQLIKTDLLYFVTALLTIGAIYGIVLVAADTSYSFRFLGLFMYLIILIIFSHASVDIARRVFDRVFFGQDVRQLRAGLTAAIDDAGRTPDLDAVLEQARETIAQISEERFVQMTTAALRSLNNVGALAGCDLIRCLPRTLAQAQALRALLEASIEQLKPGGQEGRRSAPRDLPYNILRDEYLLEKPNVQIMVRYSLCESTFHRKRREAIGVLARELKRREELFSQTQDHTP